MDIERISSRFRGRSPLPRGIYEDEKDVENDPPPEGSKAQMQYHIPPQYGISSASQAFSVPEQRVRPQSPRKMGPTLQRGRRPMSPSDGNFQMSTPTEVPRPSRPHASQPEHESGSTEGAPLYVNPKQFYRILKRRIARQKLEEVLRFTKKRKPYLHDSRHQHSMRRPRGPGGRFLTADEVVEIERTRPASGGGDEERAVIEVNGSSNRVSVEPEVQPLDLDLDSREDANSDPGKERTSKNSSDWEASDAEIRQWDASMPHSYCTERIESGAVSSGIHSRGRYFCRSRSFSPIRAASFQRWTANPRSRSAGAERSVYFTGIEVRTIFGTDDEDNWSSEDDSTVSTLSLSGDQREQVERVMETFWDMMNRNWKDHLQKKTQTSQDESGSSASGTGGKIAHKTSSFASASSLGKRPASDNEKENEERPPKRIRAELNIPADVIERIKLSCPYRKHNRRKYNVHTHRTCAFSSFPDIARIK